jgi:hypothetical protein
MLLPDETENNPVSNFDDLWNNFDQMYGGFVVKNINWDSLYNVYRPLINENSSDEELYNVLTHLLDELNDNHVILVPANSHLESYQSGVLGKLKKFSDFKESTITQNYLVEKKTIGETILYGKLQENIGYIHLNNMEESKKYYQDAMKEILDYLKNTEGLVLDIRNNSGGMDMNSVFIAGHFTTADQVAFKFRLRNGPDHNDFTSFTDYRIKPEGDSQYLKPVVLLTHRFTISAAETFTLSMALLDNVTIVGDTTSGAFSDAIQRFLPNGWVYAISVGEWRNAEGISFEGVGYPPDIVIKNDSTDVASGKDEVLEKAIDILK